MVHIFFILMGTLLSSKKFYETEYTYRFTSDKPMKFDNPSSLKIKVYETKIVKEEKKDTFTAEKK